MTVVVSIIAVTATVLFGYLAVLRAQYDRVLNVIDYVSSAHVAEARHRLGVVIHGGAVPPGEVPDRVADLFVLLWAFERVEAVRKTLPRSRRAIGMPIDGPHRLLRETVGPWVGYWRAHLGYVERALASPDTSTSARPLYSLAAAWRR